MAFLIPNQHSVKAQKDRLLEPAALKNKYSDNYGITKLQKAECVLSQQLHETS